MLGLGNERGLSVYSWMKQAAAIILYIFVLLRIVQSIVCIVHMYIHTIYTIIELV